MTRLDMVLSMAVQESDLPTFPFALGLALPIHPSPIREVDVHESPMTPFLASSPRGRNILALWRETTKHVGQHSSRIIYIKLSPANMPTFKRPARLSYPHSNTFYPLPL
jgi:hypothetical protein